MAPPVSRKGGGDGQPGTKWLPKTTGEWIDNILLSFADE